MNAAQAVVYRMPPRADVSDAVQASGTEARVRTVLARQLPRLLDIGAVLRTQAPMEAMAPLAAALEAHLQAIATLRFELLVSPGLRAAPRERDEAAFRRHVVEVSECTQASWQAVKNYMELGATLPAEIESLASDFSVELRAVQRRVHDETHGADLLRERLLEHAQSGARHTAFDAMMARNGAVRATLASLRELCEAARPAQAAAYQLAEAHAALRGTLKRLALRLGSGLLERLRVLVAGDVGAPAEELRHAQQARGDLQAALSAALADLGRVQSCGQDMAVWLDAAMHQAQALRAPDQ